MKENKIIIYYCVIVFSFCSRINAYAGHNFYHGEKLKEKVFHWNQRSTEHFVVMYKDKYFDPEQVLERLSAKFGIQSVIAGIKIKLFIKDGLAYTIVGAKTIYANDEGALAHELTHVLFLQLNRNAPISIREGIAVYAELQQETHVPAVDIKEIIALERDYSKVFRTSTARDTYSRIVQRKIESQFYAKGFCFVANIIRDRGIDAFKEFYKKCSSNQAIQTAWGQVYGKNR